MGFGLMRMNRTEEIGLGFLSILEPSPCTLYFEVFHVGTMAQRLATTGGIVPVAWPRLFPSPRSLDRGGCWHELRMVFRELCLRKGPSLQTVKRS